MKSVAKYLFVCAYPMCQMIQVFFRKMFTCYLQFKNNSIKIDKYSYPNVFSFSC